MKLPHSPKTKISMYKDEWKYHQSQHGPLYLRSVEPSESPALQQLERPASTILKQREAIASLPTDATNKL